LTGDDIRINERKRLGSGNPPHIVIDIDGGQAVFQNSRWNTTYQDILIFDDLFVHDNVHSGLTVDAGHRQNLHELILGREGVALARSVESMTREIANLQNIVREKADRITTDLRGKISVDEFCSLQNIPNIDSYIIDVERRVSALKEIHSVRATQQFDPFALPPLDGPSIQGLLSLALPDLDVIALTAVKEHFTSLGEFAENWVAEGLKYLPNSGSPGSNSCPFCGQTLEGSVIINHYRAYFGAAYKELKRSLSETRSSLKQDLGGDSLAKFQRAIETTKQRYRFWGRFIDLPDFDLDIDHVAKIWIEVRDSLDRFLGSKIASPLARIIHEGDVGATFEAVLKV
jgi:wobble nucleotide-excising tRNase